MTFEDITTFICLAETKNFSRTAETLFTSQSAISARIKALESKLGHQLFDRGNKYVKLTPAGKDFLNYALEINQLLEESQQTLKVSGKYHRQITISAPESYWDTHLLPMLGPYFDAHNDISFVLKCNYSEYVIKEILDNISDIGISFIYLKHPEIDCILLHESPFLLVCHPDLALPDETFQASTISQFPFICLDWGDMFLDWLNRNYLTRAHFLEVERVHMFLQLVLNKKGVGFLPKRIAAPYFREGTLKELDFACKESIPKESTYVVYRKKKQDLIRPILDKLISDNMCK